ncbi:MAG: TetR/AcrR family transcriptional regulator [Mycobacterium sp.]|nr:TetR/AcrR family transcriptional regulator [Mycobacterium sp.]
MAKPVAPRGSARDRVIDAALQLFADHGLRGTSLQMIAAKLGVSKAAVYYQFHSKDDIALAVVRPVFDDIARLVTIAEAVSAPEARREVALCGMIELAVRHRRTTAVFQGDPAIGELVSSHADLDAIIERLRALLLGPDPDKTTRIVMSMLSAGIYGAAMDPEMSDFTDAELQHTLLECAQQLVRGFAPAR